MLTYGIIDIQTKPSLIKNIKIEKIIDKRADVTLGYFISDKYNSLMAPVIKKIGKEEKLNKLHALKAHQDLEFAELGVDDGL